ncbi:Stp1/IreP family PP2C-type Ser/Thr phosphatase [Thermoflavimicrobium dichotomicum]|uniref:Protein phosphatase n=1 Tax=Thermoflavimicrobium dichotomicum TaxID=46223 RepID=A0A1I3SU83_9BACL|nr:Stp1/IreP family PP2C-type Ser/Thr phosphatase [Thermoflavimicrobium dichotomicum]SFJ61782.1 protein phosphatase [Thermoflavimicrobium dichotomicum]
MEIARRTNIGLVRDLNEDSTGLLQAKCGKIIAVLADGMGGHQAGDVASQKAVEEVLNYLGNVQLDIGTEEKKDQLLLAVGTANDVVYKLANQNTQYKGMGTTVLAAIFDIDEVVFAHVGDSRAYILHKDKLIQLTVDHTYVNILKEHGQITEEEARTHPQRNMLVRAVGTNKVVEVDLIDIPWSKNDIILLCSDGLTSMVSERDIGETLSDTMMTLDEKADKLIQLALDAGGKDNISLFLIRHTGNETIQMA